MSALSIPPSQLAQHTHKIKAQARALGFDLVGIAPVAPSADHARYQRWIAAGFYGEMAYLARHSPLKADPRQLLPTAQSMILVGLNYTSPVSADLRQDPSRGQIASYALGQDYHQLMRKALIRLDQQVAASSGRLGRGRVFVDSAPVLERSWGQQAGLGFIAKNTCLIHPRLGSTFFLGGLLVPERLAYDSPPRLLAAAQPKTAPRRWQFANGPIGTCGRCRRCLDACPTGAFAAPHQLDARTCISYLTIELKGEIPLALRPAMGNWVFGCDVCQQVCPWNRRSPTASHPRLQPRPDRIAPPLLELLALTDADFARRFQGSAVRRPGWQGTLRNVCVAAGNWGHVSLLPALTHHLYDSPVLVASHAAWALARLRTGAGRPTLETALTRELPPALRQAITQALALPPI